MHHVSQTATIAEDLGLDARGICARKYPRIQPKYKAKSTHFATRNQA